MGPSEVLLEQYQLQKQSLLKQEEVYTKQTTYIQVYGVFIVAVLSLLLQAPHSSDSTTMSSMISSNSIILLALLVLAALIALYLISVTMASSYMFIVLRRHLSRTEQRINASIETTGLLDFETSVAPHFLERNLYGNNSVTPHLLSGIWRTAILLTIVLILGATASFSLPDGWAVLYLIGITPPTLWQLLQYRRVYTQGRIDIEDYFRGTLRINSSRTKALYWFVFSLWLLLLAAAWLTATDVGAAVYESISAQLGDLGEIATFQSLLVMVPLYTFLCTLALLVPIEGPLVLFPEWSLALVILLSMVGRALGATVVYYLLRHYRDRIEPVFRRKAQHGVWSIILGGYDYANALIARHGFIFFFIFQAVPMLPTRTSLYIYSYSVERPLLISLTSAVATGIRMVLFLGLLNFGFFSSQELLELLPRSP